MESKLCRVQKRNINFTIIYKFIYISSLIILFGRFRNLTSFHRWVCSFCVTRSTTTSSSLKSEKAKFIKTTKSFYIHYNDKTKYIK